MVLKANSYHESKESNYLSLTFWGTAQIENSRYVPTPVSVGNIKFSVAILLWNYRVAVIIEGVF